MQPPSSRSFSPTAASWSTIRGLRWRHLGRARAYVLASGSAKAKTAFKAKTACQDFLALRNDADPEIPILKEAKTGYAKLQQVGGALLKSAGPGAKARSLLNHWAARVKPLPPYRARLDFSRGLFGFP